MKEIREKRNHNLKRINEIKAELFTLDYKTIKRLQGYYTDEVWQTHVDYCNSLREELNGLE